MVWRASSDREVYYIKVGELPSHRTARRSMSTVLYLAAVMGTEKRPPDSWSILRGCVKSVPACAKRRRTLVCCSEFGDMSIYQCIPP